MALRRIIMEDNLTKWPWPIYSAYWKTDLEYIGQGQSFNMLLGYPQMHWQYKYDMY